MDDFIKSLETLEDTASFLCSKLKDNGISVVLSGGSCMEIYTHKNFSSYDIDFISNPSYTTEKIKAIMNSLGFKEIEGTRYYKHEDNPNFIEFPSDYVQIGNELIKEFNELKTSVGTLVLLTPTDCVKDRLCAYIYHGGEECLQQAIAVAHLNPIDFKNLEKWSKNESKEIIKAVNDVKRSILVLNSKNTSLDIENYFINKSKELHLDITDRNDIEYLKNDLFNDYLTRQFLNIENNEQFYDKTTKYFSNFIKNKEFYLDEFIKNYEQSSDSSLPLKESKELIKEHQEHQKDSNPKIKRNR